MNEDRMVLDVALEAGCLLLRNGSEIFRAEETVYRICHYYGVDSCSVFTLTNGIFLTAGSETDPYFAKVKHSTVGKSHLGKVAAINQLSREIEEGRYTVEEVAQKLKEIEAMPEKADWAKTMASGFGSGAFCFLFAGNTHDSIVAFISGILLNLFFTYIEKGKLPKITKNICGGALISVVCILGYQFQIGDSLKSMISGAIMPLVPGIAFTNAIRDFSDGDYISGCVRMIDAILVFLGIAIGIGFTFLFYQRWLGGTII